MEHSESKELKFLKFYSPFPVWSFNLSTSPTLPPKLKNWEFTQGAQV